MPSRGDVPVDPRLGQAADTRHEYAWPRFLVSAPHVRAPRLSDGQERTPHGQWHARQVGSPWTVCGLAAATWHFFWTLRFDRAGTKACADCVVALSGSDGVGGRPQDTTGGAS